MDCIFCKIIKEEIKAFKLYEDENCIVILDKFPATKGQSLVISKKHESYMMNLDDKTYSEMFLVGKKIAKGIDSALITKRTALVVEGFQVPHGHIRLHPCYEEHLFLQGKEESDENLEKICKEIKKLL